MPRPGADPAPAIRPAATVVLWRDSPGGPQVLMGRRGGSAVFMPSKMVFPGGALDPADDTVRLAAPLPQPSAARLAADADGVAPDALAAAAIRELWEETGLPLAVAAAGQPAAAAGPDWARLAGLGLAPSAAALRFFFRAVTPPGLRSRRFDARFFLAPAAALAPGVPPEPSGELADLRWWPLAEARALDLPFVTAVALAEVAALLGGGDDTAGVPFFDNRGDRPVFRRLT